jgi:hypothetical protein
MSLLLELLTLEVLDTKVPYEVIKATSHAFRTQAEIGGRNVFFSATYDEDHWEIEFYEIKKGMISSGVTGSGAEFKVFAFVKSSTQEFIDRYKPDRIEFSSEKDSRSRAKLYVRLFSTLPDYELVENRSFVKKADKFVYVRKISE